MYTGICDLVLDLVQKENNCSLRFIRIVVVQKLQEIFYIAFIYIDLVSEVSFLLVVFAKVFLFSTKAYRGRSKWWGHVIRATAFWVVRLDCFTISPSLWAESLIVLNLLFSVYQVFLCFLSWLCPFLRSRKLCFGFFFRLLVFILVSIKLESGFQKTFFFCFNRGLIQFAYRGAFFLIHAISWWFCGVSKLRWSV